ncbi:DUF2752 domain-containing protein [bacterium]|nr:DUF2752 domain-containing protein [bacterium]
MKLISINIPARLKRAGVAFILLGAAIYASIWNPQAHPIGNCLFNDWTGLPCLTCGLSRSIAATGRLQFAQAFTHHPFGIILWSILIIVGSWLMFEAFRGKIISTNSADYLRNTLWLIILLWIGFGFGRLGWYIFN